MRTETIFEDEDREQVRQLVDHIATNIAEHAAEHGHEVDLWDVAQMSARSTLASVLLNVSEGQSDVQNILTLSYAVALELGGRLATGDVDGIVARESKGLEADLTTFLSTASTPEHDGADRELFEAPSPKHTDFAQPSERGGDGVVGGEPVE